MSERQLFNQNLYPSYEAMRTAQRLGHGALSLAAQLSHGALGLGRLLTPFAGHAFDSIQNHLKATVELSDRSSRQYDKPSFNLDHTYIDGNRVEINEEIVEGEDLPFGSLVHFNRDTDAIHPDLLIVAPLSGHYSTLIRDTIREMLPSHNVFVTDWKNARDVPLNQGEFGLNTYTDYVMRWMEKLGDNTNVLSICQSTVPTIAAVSRLAENNSSAQPLSMTLMAGPLDVGAAPSSVTELADTKPLDWFKRNLLAKVPDNYPGAGRIVYPGFMQLSAFISMNPERHIDSHTKLYSHIVGSDFEEAEKIRQFYDEYFAVLDMPGEFYTQTVGSVFQERHLANGTMEHNGRLVIPKAIGRTALLTVEGGRDDICPPGQTSAVHEWMTGLDPSRQFYHLQQEAGHYGVFSGSGWRNDIAPRITQHIRTAAESAGLDYDLPSSETTLIAPRPHISPRAA